MQVKKSYENEPDDFAQSIERRMSCHEINEIECWQKSTIAGRSDVDAGHRPGGFSIQRADRISASYRNRIHL
jgi:hypothetical protein